VTTPGRAARGPQRRLFFALWPDEPFCQRLAETAAPVLSALPGRMLSPADWHVTLCFLGAMDEALVPPLARRAARIDARAFELQFERVEYWREARVIAATAAAVVPERALALAGALRAAAGALGLRVDERVLRPHVTLARGVPAPAGAGAGAGAAGAGLVLPEPGLMLQAREFHLAASPEPVPGRQEEQGQGQGQDNAPGGPPRRYVTLGRWPLRG
jgi:2'-5' RNA ligase